MRVACGLHQACGDGFYPNSKQATSACLIAGLMRGPSRFPSRYVRRALMLVCALRSFCVVEYMRKDHRSCETRLCSSTSSQKPYPPPPRFHDKVPTESKPKVRTTQQCSSLQQSAKLGWLPFWLCHHLLLTQILPAVLHHTHSSCFMFSCYIPHTGGPPLHRHGRDRQRE